MKRILAGLAASALFLLALPAAADTSVSPGETGSSPVSLFFDESEAAQADDGYDFRPSPAVWIFAAVGVASLAAVGALVWVNRTEKR